MKSPDIGRFYSSARNVATGSLHTIGNGIGDHVLAICSLIPAGYAGVNFEQVQYWDTVFYGSLSLYLLAQDIAEQRQRERWMIRENERRVSNEQWAAKITSDLATEQASQIGYEKGYTAGMNAVEPVEIFVIKKPEEGPIYQSLDGTQVIDDPRELYKTLRDGAPDRPEELLEAARQRPLTHSEVEELRRIEAFFNLFPQEQKDEQYEFFGNEIKEMDGIIASYEANYSTEHR